MKRAVPILIIIAVVIAACSVSARADEVYAVSGALTLVGNNACAGPCTETVNFSFDLDYQYCGSAIGCLGWPYGAYYSNFVDSGSGALGSFTGSFAGPAYFRLSGGDNGYLAAGSPGGEIDIYANALSETPGPPSLVAASLYSCYTTTCVTDFIPTTPQNGDVGVFGVGFQPPVLGIFLDASMESTITPVSTPEPPVWMLLLVGMIGLLGFYSVRKIRKASADQQEIVDAWNKTRGNLPEWRHVGV
jgi:hypothetical protein